MRRYFFICFRFREREESEARVSNCFIEVDGMFNVSNMSAHLEKWRPCHVAVIQSWQEITLEDYKALSANTPQYILEPL